MKFSETMTNLPIDIMATMTYFFKTHKILKLKTPFFVCEGFCLFASMIALEFQAEDFEFYNTLDFYKNPQRDEEIKQNLLKTKKYKNKTISDDQIKEIIAKNNLTDIRNSLFHGNFEIEKIDKEKYFVLTPQRPNNISKTPIKLRFKDIFDKAFEKYQDFQSISKKNPGMASTMDKNTFKLLSLAYLEMAYFFSGRIQKVYQTQEWILKMGPILLQYLFGVQTAYEQNNLYPYLKNHPRLKQKLCIYRNSTIHANTILENKRFKFIDIDQRNNTREEISPSLSDYNKDLSDMITLSMIGTADEISQSANLFIKNHPELQPQEIENLKADIATLQDSIIKLKKARNLEEDENENPNE